MNDKHRVVYICEKPSQAKDIAAALGLSGRQDGYYCRNNLYVTWCFGHLLSLAPPDDYESALKPWRMDVLPVVPDPKRWKMIENPKSLKQLNIVRGLIKKAEHVVIATDADREGEVIAREILDDVKFEGKISRLWLSALDETSIHRAIDNVKDGKDTYGLYLAGLGRARADWLMGMNMTMGASVLFSTPNSGVLSIGRVQTPTLSMIVKRDKSIEAFVPQNYFDLYGNFSDGSNPFSLKWQVPENMADDGGRCLDEAAAKAVAQAIENKSAEVVLFSDKNKRTSPPLAFSLSELQKQCASKFGLSAKETLEVAQSLYEKHKATTYPRTDCGYLPITQHEDARSILYIMRQVGYDELVQKSDPKLKSKTWNDKKVRAHHGIIPTTKKNINLDQMSDRERQVYDLICRYYIAQFLGNYGFVERTIEVKCEDNTFGATMSQTAKLGWKEAIGIEEKESDKKYLPKLEKGGKIDCISAEIKQKKTTPLPRYNEGSLISAMKNVAKMVDNPGLKKILKEESGIGTEATRADIIEKLLSRDYIKREKKYLVSTKKGRDLIDLVPDVFRDPVTTALWGQQLDDIASDADLDNAKLKLESFLENQGTLLIKSIEAIKKHPHANHDGVKTAKCDACGGIISRREGKYGMWWGCCNYPKCKNTMDDQDGKPVPKFKKEKPTSDHPCPKCKKGHLIRRPSKNNGYWWGCNQFPKCKAKANDDSGVPII